MVYFLGPTSLVYQRYQGYLKNHTFPNFSKVKLKIQIAPKWFELWKMYVVLKCCKECANDFEILKCWKMSTNSWLMYVHRIFTFSQIAKNMPSQNFDFDTSFWPLGPKDSFPLSIFCGPPLGPIVEVLTRRGLKVDVSAPLRSNLLNKKTLPWWVVYKRV